MHDAHLALSPRQPTGVSRIEDLDPEQFGAADQATAQSGGFRDLGQASL